MSDKNKWAQKFYVPKKGGGGLYTISLAADFKTWACSCSEWIFKRNNLPDGACKHIKLIKETGGIGYRKPAYITSNKTVKPIFDLDKNELICPNLTYPSLNTTMEVVVAFYMLNYGFTIREIRSIRGLPETWTGEYVRERISHIGNDEYTELLNQMEKERTTGIEISVRKLLI